MKKFLDLKTLILSTERDARKFYEKNNRTAGTRVRKALLLARNLAQEIRLEVSDRKNAK